MSIVSAQVFPRKAFYDGVREPRLSFMIGSDQAKNDLRIDIVDAAGQTVRTFYRNDVAPGATNAIRWDGSIAGGRAAGDGEYTFRISSQASPSARLSSTSSKRLSFSFYSYIFPLPGPHTYGDGIGVGRAGHTHQGQDLGAACGMPVLAARGGRVQYKGFQAGGAGNYIVIDGKGTGQDLVYMHLKKPATLPLRSQVRTGQVIGHVGGTGNASGCLLHFELWSAPGWYEGGRFLDPTPFLKRADRHS